MREASKNADYVAWMQAREKEAEQIKTTYKRLINNRNHPFTEAQFTAIIRCLHPDTLNETTGERAITGERLNTAFLLLKDKKLQLTGREWGAP